MTSVASREPPTGTCRTLAKLTTPFSSSICLATPLARWGGTFYDRRCSALEREPEQDSAAPQFETHGVPDLLKFASIAKDAGADGITVHPRSDERHILADDVYALAELMAPWRPAFELNVEGYPDERLIDIVRKVKPEQCTLVPDAPEAFTSEEGWKLDNRDTSMVLGIGFWVSSHGIQGCFDR